MAYLLTALMCSVFGHILANLRGCQLLGMARSASECVGYMRDLYSVLNLSRRAYSIGIMTPATRRAMQTH